MLVAPASWVEDGAQAAYVECDGAVHLCTVARAPPTATVFSVEAAVAIDRALAQRLTAQDCRPASVARVAWLDAAGRGPSAARRFLVCDAGDCSGADMRVVVPTRTRVAAAVTLSGPRLDARATPAALSAALTGRFVAVGATVQGPAGSYRVVQVEAPGGSHGGAVLVGGGCRIKINDAAPAVAAGGASRPATAELVGLEAERQRLEAVLAAARDSPGRAFGVLVHGPRGCGVRTLVEAALAAAEASAGGCHVVQWSPSLDAALLRHRCRCRTVALVVPHCERFFDAANGAAAMTARALQRDVAALTRRVAGPTANYQPSVVVAAYTHRYGALCGAGGLAEGLFSTTVAVALPDAGERAALLSHGRGVPAGACVAEAHSLVGRTRAEVLDAARGPPRDYRPPFAPVRWAEIGGLAAVKARLHEALVWPQQHPEAFQRFGLTPPKGVLLYGPPGCAKTTLVKALCSEGYFSLIYLDSASVVSAYVGESERYLRDVFARAAQQAPCIVFFDEVEVLGARRAAGGGGGGRDSENTRLLSTLLTEMDGFAAASGVCFIGATNVPHLLDDALLRPGRFDFLVHVPLPSTADRAEILSLYLRHTAADVASIATATEGFSGADINALCSSALLDLVDPDDASAPPCLTDAETATSHFLRAAAAFKRTDYDRGALDTFHRTHHTD